MFCKDIYIVPKDKKYLIVKVSGAEEDWSFDYAFIDGIHKLVYEVGGSHIGFSTTTNKGFSSYITLQEIEEGKFKFVTDMEIESMYNITHEDFIKAKLNHYKVKERMNPIGKIIEEINLELETIGENKENIEFQEIVNVVRLSGFTTEEAKKLLNQIREGNVKTNKED